MIFDINDNITLWREQDPIKVATGKSPSGEPGENRNLDLFGFQKERIAIKEQWFDVIPLGELFHWRNKVDGYYRVVYVQINMENGEYYIGKANRPNWSEIKRYQDSGLKFKSKFKKNTEKFARHFIAAFDTAEETEQLEATLVDAELLADQRRFLSIPLFNPLT